MRDFVARVVLTVVFFSAAAVSDAASGVQDSLSPCPTFEQERCRCSQDLKDFYCRAAGITHVPHQLPVSVVKLDLTSNNITTINETSLARYDHLEELILSDNTLERIHPDAFARNIHLKRLLLQGCGLKQIPSEALIPLVKLQTLHVGSNEIWRIQREAFRSVATSLRSLRLDSNQLRIVPAEALAVLAHLEVLNIGNNLITSLSSEAFPRMKKLVVL